MPFQRVTRSGGRRKEKDVKVSREDRLEARRQRRDVTLAKALMSSPSKDEQSDASAAVAVDEHGNPIEQPEEQAPPVVYVSWSLARFQLTCVTDRN